MEVYTQFAKKFNSVEEMEAYKKKIAEEREKKALEALEAVESTAPAISRVVPSILPTGEREKSTFSTIRQGTATNALTKIKPSTKRNTIIDTITGTATITQGNLSITIPDFTKLTGFRTSTYQLLDALTVALTETGAKSPVVALSLEEYMKKRGLKDKKEARKQVTDDLETLFNATISFKEKRKKGQEQDFHDIRIIDSKGIRKGIITVTFGTAFYKILLGYPIMPYPAQLWELNSKRNPNSFYLLRKIAEHKNMNVGKKNEDIIAVKTLLAVAPYLPSYEEVMNTDRAISRRIIEPFERDMDALEDTLTWTYCHSNNTPLTDEELSSMSYDTFISLFIKIDWKQYPDQTARLERKAERIEQAEQGKKRKTSNRRKQKKGGNGQQKGG